VWLAIGHQQKEGRKGRTQGISKQKPGKRKGVLLRVMCQDKYNEREGGKVVLSSLDAKGGSRNY